MTAINFPDSPSDGDTHVVGQVTYTYNSAETKWKTTINSNNFLPTTGGTLTGNLNMGTNDLTVGDVTASGTASLSGLTYPTSDGTPSQFLQTNGSGTLSFATVTDTGTGWTWGDTANALSGTSVSVTGIPSTARRIIIDFYEVSLDSAQNFFIRVGDSSGLASSGYFTRSVQFYGGTVYDTNFSSGWYTYGMTDTNNQMNGTITLDKMDGNKWLGVAFIDGGTATDNTNFLIGEVALSGTLDRVGLETASGNFDNGKFFVSYLEP